MTPNGHDDACHQTQLGYAHDPVAHRLGRGIDGVAKAELRRMSGYGESSTQQGRNEHKGWIPMPCGSGGESSRCRRTYERMNGVPGRGHCGDERREELDGGHKKGSPNHP